jgi:hypothetical protein
MTDFPVNAEEITQLIGSQEEFQKYFTKVAVTEKFGEGFWKNDGHRGWKLHLPNGSYIRVKFFDVLKNIYNSKNIIVPGRESLLSYADITVNFKDRKGYGFKAWICQHVCAITPGKPRAAVLHAENIVKMIDRANALGIDLVNNKEEAWETYYARFDKF